MAVAPVDPGYNVDAEIAGAPLDSSGAGGGSTVDPYDTSQWDVYLGSETRKAVGYSGKFLGGDAGYVPQNYKRATYKTDIVKNTQEASIDYWYQMSQAQRLRIAEKAFALGYISDPKDLTAAQKAWTDAVTNAAGFYKFSGQKITPEKAMDMYAGSTGSAKQKLGPDGKPLANRTIARKHREVDLTRPDQARALIKQAFQTSVGRDPTDEEIRTLTRTLHDAELKASTRTTTKYDQFGDPIDIVNETTGGVSDPEQFIADQIEKDPEAAAYQGATTYFNSLMGMLGSPF